MKYLFLLFFLNPLEHSFAQKNDFYEGFYERNTAHSQIMFENLTLKGDTFKWQSLFYESYVHASIIEGTFQIINDTLLQLKPQKSIYYENGEKVKSDSLKSTFKIRSRSNPGEWNALSLDFMTAFKEGKRRLKPNYQISIEDGKVTLTAESSKYKKQKSKRKSIFPEKHH
ncbi:MAG: hypothetical protein ACI9XO_004282 [Paraglaciecola sp.]|jgi:hypothetical protein